MIIEFEEIDDYLTDERVEMMLKQEWEILEKIERSEK